MLLNLLPGLRQLRAPLAAGYMWLITTWLWLDHFRLIPESRPPGDSRVARLWDIGSGLGKATLLAILTFIAYLLGSFLEIDADNRRLRSVVPYVVRWRPSYQLVYEERPYPNDIRAKLRSLRRRLSRLLPRALRLPPLRPKTKTVIDNIVNALFENDKEGARRIAEVREFPEDGRKDALFIATSFSREARDSLVSLLVDGGQVQSPDRVKDLFDDLLPSDYDWGERIERYNLRMYVNYLLEYRADLILRQTVFEIPQLASRLLVKNKELYGRYDRFKSEGSFRINISIALLALFWTATFLAQLPVAANIALLAVAFAVAILLLRQGLLRSISANDVIAQAIAIDEVQSQYIKSQKKTPEPTAASAERKSPSGDDAIQESPEAQQDQQSPLRTEETGTAP